ncbi:MAG: GNAT family N-acetyltransferase [Pseudomonadales bacterium]|nr:GNAT family N-acetyltransferase [Pseudomonadales bacterium]MCP5183066.1 GNAT family N-acetyltransferase [Pseudomonadales bacterium]
MQVEPVVLSGAHVRLEPLTADHVEALWAVAQYPEIWRYMPFRAGTREEYEGLVGALLSGQRAGLTLPFVTVRLHPEPQVVGSTSFLEINPVHHRLEIGSTWVTPAHQRSPVNTEAKLLQMTHAFEVLGCNRVEFKTDSLNATSRAALARIGAVEEGTFRNHMIMPDGRIRHSVWFSITREEWPAAKARLVRRLSD